MNKYLPMTAERFAEIKAIDDDNGSEYASERVWQMLHELICELDRIAEKRK
jgi:hypothetical protein